MNVFMDTEFTDLLDPVLISLGMVTDRGEEFYIEVPYPDKACTPFVREAVLPLLGREPDAYCPLEEVRLRLLKWLEIVRRPPEDLYICIDYQTDWDLFWEALDGQVPAWCLPKMIGRDLNELLLYSYFWRHPDAREHHALDDARANAYAYRPRPKEK